MKASELRELSREELLDMESDLAQQLFTLRLQIVTGQLENPAKVKQARRDLARVLTVLHEIGDGSPETGGGSTSPARQGDSEPATESAGDPGAGV